MITVTIRNKNTNETKEYYIKDGSYRMFIALSHLYYFYRLDSGAEAFSSIRIPEGKWFIVN